MSESLHDIPLSEDPGKKNQDFVSNPLSPTTIEQIQNDPKLQKLGEDPEKRSALLSFLEENNVPLAQSDNLTEQTRIKDEWLGKLGYNNIASDGMNFTDFLERYGEKAMDEAKSLLDQKVWTKEDYENFLKHNNTISNIDITKEKKLKDISINNLSETKKEVESIKKKLSTNDQKFLTTYLESAVSWQTENAAVEELKKQGVTQEDIESGKYDSYIEASIIVEHASQFEAYKQDPKGFSDSIKSLQRLGIPVKMEPDFQKYSEHIATRFAPGDRTDAVTYQIRTGLGSGEYQSLHYDGKGEQYTLIGADGKTRKDITLDRPPRAEIRMSTLHIGHEISPPTPEETKRQEYIESYRKNFEKASKIDIEPVKEDDPEKSREIQKLYETARNRNLGDPKTNMENRLEALSKLRRINSERKDENLEKTLLTFSSPEPKNSQLEEEGRRLTDLESVYQEEQKIFEAVIKLPPNREDGFDRNAKKNLEWLTTNHFDRMGPDAQEALDKIIAYENRGRTESTKIRLDKAIDPTTNDAKILKDNLAKLGITPESIKTDKLTDIQRSISQMLTKDIWDAGSIERTLSQNGENLNPTEK